MRRRLAALVASAAVLLTGCTAPYDDDGELMPPGDLSAPAAKSRDAVDVVVDTDLAPDDLVALAYLMRHPDVRVLAVTVPTTGIVRCPAGVDLAHALMAAVRVEPVPVACGRTPRGPHGRPFPTGWMVGARENGGLPRDHGTEPTGATPNPRPATRLLADLARAHDALEVVALAPATELAALLEQDPAAYARIARIVTMAGVVEGPPQEPAIGEWNAAADPEALARVLAGPVPVTVVPHEVVADGPPDGLRAPVVGAIGLGSSATPPRFWDLATAAYVTLPDAGRTRSGRWTVHVRGEPGRLAREGAGTTQVVTELDHERLDRSYREVFAAD